ncbi:MAG TPA: hypothetical protein VGP15_03085, partial [Burkholderiales bacterium]|nr:hypothetical protein [Burkholderiales bacterium]
PEVSGGSRWKCLVDTNIAERRDEPVFAAGEEFEVTGRSLLLFVLQNGDAGEPSPADSGGLGRRRSDDAGRAGAPAISDLSM